MLINFDFDGVLVDSFEQVLSLCRYAQQAVGAGRPPVAEDLRTVKDLTFEGLGRQLGMLPVAIQQFRRVIFNNQQKIESNRGFFPGMAELVKELAQDHDLTIITSNQIEAVQNQLVREGLEDVFLRITGGATEMSKRETIVNNIKLFDAGVKDTFMIGDAVSDIQHGKAANIRTIAVSWGFHSREMLLAEVPDSLVDSPEELLACFTITEPPGGGIL